MSDNVCVMKGEGREGDMEKKGGWRSGGGESHTDRLNRWGVKRLSLLFTFPWSSSGE